MIEIAHDLMRRPRGIVRLYTLVERGRRAERAGESASCVKIPERTLIYEADNLYVNAGLPVLANLLAAGAPGYVAAAIGFGAGNTAPTVTDTDLTLAPKYYNAIGTHTIGPSGAVAAGSVLFNYALTTTDYAANPLTIQELGLFANSGGVALPVMVGGTFGAWAAAHAYPVGNLIIDANGNTQRCTTAGTSGGAAPTWATAMSATTTDNTAGWTLVALHTPPGPMIAHVVVPSFPYAGGANYSGTWTISM